MYINLLKWQLNFNVTNVFYNSMNLDFCISKCCMKKALWASQERLNTLDLQVMVPFWWCTRSQNTSQRHGEFLYRLRCWNLPWSSRTPSAWVRWVKRPFENSRLRKEKATPTTSLGSSCTKCGSPFPPTARPPCWLSSKLEAAECKEMKTMH